MVSTATERTIGLDKAFSNIPEGSIVSYEPELNGKSPSSYHIDAMLCSQKYNLYVINGYTGSSPRAYRDFWMRADSSSRNYWLGSNENMKDDSLYIVRSENDIELIAIQKIIQENKSMAKEDRISNIINTIKKDEKWLESIEQKAINRNIPLDSMLLLDALWMIENEGK